MPSMLRSIVLLVLLSVSLKSVLALGAQPLLEDKQWNHGAEDCAKDEGPPIEVYAYSETSFILRQNMCLSFEAPFMYVLLGDDSALLVDTGASENSTEFPLYETVKSLIGEKPLLVVHSHGHGDHRGADIQFEGVEGVTLVRAEKDAVMNALAFSDWPEGEGVIQLGGRELTVIPIPGHQEESVAVYDPQTKWLLTGDTVYPGLIYVKNWQDYRDSIARLARFAEQRDVSLVLGSHIEATHRQGEYYPIGATYQPEEAPLPIRPEVLATIDAQLQQLPKATEVELARLRIVPMSLMQRSLSDVARWLRQ
ncbi:MAG: MBL fold metallo-hydrolase [Halioglobus sp.]